MIMVLLAEAVSQSKSVYSTSELLTRKCLKLNLSVLSC